MAEDNDNGYDDKWRRLMTTCPALEREVPESRQMDGQTLIRAGLGNLNSSSR
jgi:hypothetical protein